MTVDDTTQRAKELSVMGSTVACFGELLLRLNAPGRSRLLQMPRLEVHFGGAEANVAVSLARLGHPSAVISIVPDNALGRACVAELRKHGVMTDAIRFTIGRMGLYFVEAGAIQRPTEVLYDRAGSAFAAASPDMIDWDETLAGCSWLHVSGITPAVGPNAVEAALRSVRAARRLGLSVSFDCNYRARLWQSWGGDAARILRELAAEADLLFGDDRVLAMMLERDFNTGTPAERFERAANHAFSAFGHMARIATTVRVQHSIDQQELAALMSTRGKLVRTGRRALAGVVDRIGAGDAFAAGMLHGLLSSLADDAMLEFALAAACIKHSIPGDFNLTSVHEIEALIRDRALDVRR